MSALITRAAGLLGLCLVLASCGDSGDAAGGSTTTSTAETPTSISTTAASGSDTSASTAPLAPPSGEAPTSTTAPVSTDAPSSTGVPTTNAEPNAGQDQPTINGWRLDVESQPCEESNLPGSPGGEAVVPASWAAGNADFVEFVVDGDLRPANLVREVVGPGNIQVPCDPALNDGHEITIVAYTGTAGDPGPSTSGETLIVITTATVDGNDGASGDE